MKLILASDNAHKLLEFQKLFQGTDVELMTKKEAGFTDEVAETGTTFAENAYIKAEAVMRATGCAAIADDSGHSSTQSTRSITATLRRRTGRAARSAPYLILLRGGFALRAGFRPCPGGILLHHFTLAARKRRSVLCGTFHWRRSPPPSRP